MPVDTSIYRINPLRSVSDYEAEIDAARQREMAMQANALSLSEAKAAAGDRMAARDRTNRLQSILGGFGGDSASNTQALMRGGFMKEATDYQKSVSDAAKARSEQEKAQIAQARERLALVGQVAGAAKDQPSYERGLALLANAGIDVSNEPAQFDPAYVDAAVKRALTVDQQLAQIWKQKGYDLEVEKFGEQKRHAQAQERVAQGQLGVAQGNLAVSRGNLEQRKTEAAYQQTKDAQDRADKKVGGVDQSKITEGERTASGYASRMVEATKLLDRFEESGKPTYKTQMVGSIPLVGKAAQREAMSVDQQRYRQAAEDWVRAKLRKESGAVIGKDEMDAEIATYFPMPGDKPETIAQKRQARAVATQAMIKGAGRGYSAPVEEAPPNESKSDRVIKYDASGKRIQ